jgi:hypothetical protein
VTERDSSVAQNLDHVVAFRWRAGGRMVAELDDGGSRAVSRERAKELRLLGVQHDIWW